MPDATQVLYRTLGLDDLKEIYKDDDILPNLMSLLSPMEKMALELSEAGASDAVVSDLCEPRLIQPLSAMR
jgi:hypothetical protein